MADDQNMTATVHVIIQGRVQGVWFRAWTEGQARKRGLSGWVRNCADGTVEALFSGPTEHVEAMLVKCHKGPPLARVDGVAQHPETAPDRPGFFKLPTA